MSGQLRQYRSTRFFCATGCRQDVPIGPLAYTLTFAPMAAAVTCPYCGTRVEREISEDLWRQLHDIWSPAALELSTFAVQIARGPRDLVAVLEAEPPAPRFRPGGPV